MKNSGSDLIMTITTAQTKEDAEKIAHYLVNEHLSACAQVDGPIISYYWWEGRIEKSQEWRCVIKTLASKYKELEEAIKKMHPYSVPQIIAIPIHFALPEYEAWAKNNVLS